VLLFSPLWNSGRSPYTAYYEMLASHGFIVAAIEHPLDYPNVAFSVASQKDARPLDLRLGKRVLDARFILDQVDRMNKDDSRELFSGKFDLDRVGILGHSFGGSTAAEACFVDPRFKAGMSLDGNLYGTLANGSPKQPFFFFESEAPEDLDPLLHGGDSERKLWAELEQIDRSRKIRWLQQRGGYFLKIRGSLHMDYSDHPLYSPLKRLSSTSNVDPTLEQQIVNSYMLAFFEKSLNGREEPILEKSPSPFALANFSPYPGKNSPADPFQSKP
jgi:pimeloyl-ACP methyl ester carboxylesterase